MPLSQPLLEPGTEVSRFRVEELIGRGGMGQVYRARDLRLDRPVALKVLSPELSDDDGFRLRFVRECRTAASLDHPHVVPVYEADDWHGLLYIAMRFVRGADLHTVLGGGRLPVDTALTLLAQAASALDAAHEAGLVHRDVKPGNLLVTGAAAGSVPSGAHLYLTDFGLTKRTSSLSGLTSTGQFLGSLHYVAPEQIRGEEVDGRADLYALACVAFELLTGIPPFRRDQEAALLWAHMSVEPPSLTELRPELPAAMAAVLARGMAKDRDDRPASCGAFVADLRSAAGAPETARTVPVPVSSAAPTVIGPSTSPTVVGPGTSPPVAGRGTAPPPLRSATPAAPRRDTPAPVAGTAPDGPAPGSRRPRRWTWPVAALALVAAVVAGALVWSPWSEDGGKGTAGGDLAARSLEVVPYTAELPVDWQAFPLEDGGMAFGPADLADVALDDESDVAEATRIAAEEPDRLVLVYVAGDTGLGNEAPADVPGQVAAGLPAGTEIDAGSMGSVGGQRAVRLRGEVPLDDGSALSVVGVAVGGEVLLLCVVPEALADDWAGTFDAVIGSLAPE
ncbi:serine/threonine-protein kinase [Trujillonella endophytica]|uniref:non-specific serine/threonine protein kinase n=1 Tax=Trujillonella endophytica TaxID=673521 RepID=A0A1H8SG59_9ACTN|nr:serine/threonine-protein kinase [Trujillella endophytica]SEO77642.1 Serine/threonine protein kinase [Trujillella endophytica]